MKDRSWLYSLAVKGLMFILVISCKKNEVPATLTITDIDGNNYKTVTIGRQVWMAENLRVTKYNNGDLIGTTTPPDLDITYETDKKYQWAYNGIEPNASVYGRLYTWFAVTDSRKICPTGWHVPADSEWSLLPDGGALKEAGTAHWSSPNTGATNSTGFTALPGGYRSEAVFNDVGFNGNWWSSTENPDWPGSAWYRNMNYSYKLLYADYFPKVYGFSVRCVKD
jgi:uncharacterized protein (TIGR02145 family)